MPDNVLVKFSAGFTSPTLEVSHGHYQRLFAAGDQPFSVSVSEYDLILSPVRFDKKVDGKERSLPVFEVVSPEPNAAVADTVDHEPFHGFIEPDNEKE